MNKEAQMTFRVEHDLRRDFAEAVASVSERPAAQLLRQFMRKFSQAVEAGQVLENGETEAIEKMAIEIAHAELLGRVESAKFGIASVALEGLKLPAEYQNILIQRAKDGKFDSQELIDLVTRQ